VVPAARGRDAVIIRPDGWLSEQLGRPAFTVAAAEARPADIREAFASHQSPAAAFYTAKVGMLDTAALEALTAEGFTVIETSLTFERPIDRHAPVAQVSVCQPQWHGAVLDIAEHAFRYSRFHVDPGIDRVAADRIKREWIQSYVDGRRGDTLLVAHDGGTAIGFNAMLVADRPSGPVAVIDLIGVHPDHQQRGAGRLLIDGALNHYQERCRSLEVGTQASNIPSVRLYESAGFRLTRSAFVLHRHR
jgi:ribosomal protein S18 acetylase RimI-like enzyme